MTQNSFWLDSLEYRIDVIQGSVVVTNSDPAIIGYYPKKCVKLKVLLDLQLKKNKHKNYEFYTSTKIRNN